MLVGYTVSLSPKQGTCLTLKNMARRDGAARICLSGQAEAVYVSSMCAITLYSVCVLGHMRTRVAASLPAARADSPLLACRASWAAAVEPSRLVRACAAYASTFPSRHDPTFSYAVVWICDAFVELSQCH